MSRVELLVLRAGDALVLGEWTRASSIPAGLAQRARILLLAAEGHSNTEIGRLVGVSLPTVRLWRGRYTDGGLEALGDLHRSGRPAIHDETSIIAVTPPPPPAAWCSCSDSRRSPTPPTMRPVAGWSRWLSAGPGR